MINLEPQQQYPVFFKSATKTAWTALNKQANDILGYESEGAKTYSQPIIDAEGGYWFVVNPEVASLVDLTKCVSYDEIVLPKPNIK